MSTHGILIVYSALVSLKGASSMLVPDEQRLYENVMLGYEKSVRPVINASTVLSVTFGLKLNQIIDLDERHQVLTTNVFIDQAWKDENLRWDPANYSQIRSIRVPSKRVWLPDTFIYNNADDGSTGFMQGTYVLLNYDGIVVWPVPVKLKSSCKVDITYFPFDDQECILRFGSWIYSGSWIDYHSLHNNTSSPVDLTAYVNNSEWDLLSVTLKKNIRTHSCCADPHPDITYVLHIRRKTFYYIFNIIVPCVMLSALTLLTFWLPPTSGEKITLGLSVFLAFSMFMLLIAEEVPATSESVPLIGIYLCVVMTMTSLSVIMAVIVINLYNRGHKTKRAPVWLRVVTLVWLSKIMFLKHDLFKFAKDVVLDDERKGAYACKKHSFTSKQNDDVLYQELETLSLENQFMQNRVKVGKAEGSISEARGNESGDEYQPLNERTDKADISEDGDCEISDSEETGDNNNTTKEKMLLETGKSRAPEVCRTRSSLFQRKLIVAEWQQIASVIDRVLFWFYFLSTVVSYILILVVVPNYNYKKWNEELWSEQYNYHSV
ncbi:neuronal acetylcholine receptor subunit alpha-10-like isoform X2 [Ostrea edulis]|uniref:neuronal acetylcholine receptor subunit alpha-10-like isoform X2 n=1 Tax=Ostrea edulis TaxID=37623 RepID=UPI00209598FD|nr:neuronal acetylcholine receptor subunit alpha-10-like isoform X2 [Ostrea edulis]